ncbi:MAG: hypothetical protein HPY76_05040 [Anaerolineae bacterium]|nr:hypothetical protein [Anaerolineae bacterium]
MAGARQAKRWAVVVTCAMCLLACTLLTSAPESPQLSAGTETHTGTLTTTATLFGSAGANATPGVWSPYPPPILTPATAVPPPFEGLTLPEGARVLVLLGTGEAYPLTGSTDAVMLVFYHSRNQRVALVSLSPDLFVYIPGYNMQRLSAAFGAVGAAGFIDTMTYNFSITPQEWAVIHLDSLEKMAGDLGGLPIEPLE